MGVQPVSQYCFVALGGAAGSVLRYALQGLVQRCAGLGFPMGTLAVNVVGCLAVGLFAVILTGPFAIREGYRLALTVGLLGGFTTFSAFGFETFQLASSGHGRLAVLNVLVSVAGGLSAVWTGHRLAQWLFG